MAAQDPFVVVKQDVESSLKNVDALYKRWKQLLESPGSSDVSEFEWTTNELRTTLKSIEWDLEDLEETITIVEESPDKFAITSSELASRKQFIKTTKSSVREIKAHTDDPEAKTKIQRGKEQSLMGRKGKFSRYEKLEQQAREENDNFIGDQDQQQQMIMREQDSQLQEVGQTIHNLKTMGRMIGDEIEDQNDLLEDFDQELNTTTDRLMHTIKKVDRALALSKDGKSTCCICLLLLALIILIIVYFT